MNKNAEFMNSTVLIEWQVKTEVYQNAKQIKIVKVEKESMEKMFSLYHQHAF